MLGGDTFSGKTSFINVFARNSFGYTQSTFSAGFISESLTINNSEIYFDNWDTYR